MANRDSAYVLRQVQGRRHPRGVRKLQETTGSVRTRLEALVDQLARMIEHMQVAMPLLLEFYGVAAREPSVRQFLTEAYQDYHDVLTDMLEQGEKSIHSWLHQSRCRFCSSRSSSRSTRRSTSSSMRP